MVMSGQWKDSLAGVCKVSQETSVSCEQVLLLAWPVSEVAGKVTTCKWGGGSEGGCVIMAPRTVLSPLYE